MRVDGEKIAALDEAFLGLGAGVMNNGSPVDVVVMVHGRDGTNLVILNGMY